MLGMGPLTVCLMGARPVPPACHIQSSRVWEPVAGVHRAMFICHSVLITFVGVLRHGPVNGDPGPSLAGFRGILPSASSETV